MFNKLKQLNDLKNKAKELQEVLSKESEQGSAGWGKVKVTMNGNQKVTAIEIDQELLSDKAKLENLMMEAVNDAIGKIQVTMAKKLKDVGGLDLASEFGDAIK